MNIVLEDIAPCRKRLKIEVPAKQVSEELEKITQDFQNHAKIPGFRPGKAPKAMIEKRFSGEIETELKRSFVPRSFREAVRSKKLRVVSQPMIEDLHFQKGMSLSFSTVVDLAPEFPLPDYKSIRVSKTEIDPVTDTNVNEMLEAMTSRFADYRAIDGRDVQEGDFVVMDYTASDADGKPLKDMLPSAQDLAERKNFWLWIKSDSFLPDFAMQLVGAKADETREVKITFPEDFGIAELKDKKAVYSVHVREIKERILPEVNDEFTKKNFQCTVEELKQKIRSDLETRRKHEVERKNIRDIVDQLIKMTNFDLPESLVQQQTQRLIQDIVLENQHRGISEEILKENKEKIFSSASTNAKEHVKVGFILNRIAETEKIEVTADELNLELNILAHRYQMKPQKLVEEIQKAGSLGEIEENILNRKTMEFLVKSSTAA